MSRIAYVDGVYAPHDQAFVHIEDRGFQFADSVYEVWAVFDGRLADFHGHLQRLRRSLGELEIGLTMTDAALTVALRETVRRNRVREGLLYLQISRGVARRDHVFPPHPVRPTVVATARSIDRKSAEEKALRGVKVITCPDQRWARCDIKTTGLLANVLVKERARRAGAAEAWMVDADGVVTEGGSTNAWIIDADGVLRTRQATSNILRGVTRQSLIEIAAAEGTPFSERGFSIEEAALAREAFYTAASAFVMPVVEIDGRPVGQGAPGPLTLRLRRLYLERARNMAI